MQLQGKVAIVTGAGTGLGLAIAKRYAAEGAKVVIADLRGAEAAAQSLADEGAEALGLEVDITSEGSVAAMVEKTLSRFGGLHVLVNNAAFASELKLGPFEEQTVGEWTRVLQVNMIGVFICVKAVAPHMRQQKWGRIINVASGTAFKGAPFMLHYVASKGGVMTMTRALANELGKDNVVVNAISPGYTLSENNLANTAFLEHYRQRAIETRAIPRDAWPDDIAAAAVFLAGEDSRWVTGQILAVDGGSVYH